MTPAPCLALVLLALTAAQVPQPGNPYLDAASELYARQRFAEARARLEIALQVPGIPDAQRARALDLLAHCHVAEGRRDSAELAYSRLLSADPDWELAASASPKVREPFDATKRALFRRDLVELRVAARKAEAVTVELVDPWRRVASLLVRRPRAGAPPLEEAVARSRFVAVPLRAPGEGQDSPWEVLARSEDGEPLASVASEGVPGREVAGPAADPASGPFAAAPASPATLPASSSGAPSGAPSGAASGARVPGWVLSAAAVASVVAATALELQSQDTARRARASAWAGETLALNDQARTEAFVAIGLYALAGGAAAGATVAFLW